MNTSLPGRKPAELDLRVVRLFSRKNGIQNGPFFRNNANKFLAFSYFDGIEVSNVVKSADRKSEDNMFLLAYNDITSYRDAEKGAEMKSYVPYQTILAFADISVEQDDLCYTNDEISAFWKEDSTQLFFVTLLNIKGIGTIDETLKKIKEIFQPKCHLVYYTFDHSDLIIFTKAKSFDEYANKIFKLDYKYSNLIEDSITVFSFPRDYRCDAEGPTFGAILCAGVHNFAGMNAFLSECGTKDRGIKDYWLLGRNDIALFYPEATLKWLQDTYDKARKSENATLFTTYELMVLIPIKEDLRNELLTQDSNGNVNGGEGEQTLPDSGIPSQSKNSREDVVQKCCEKIGKLFESFKANYINICEKTGVMEDNVWLHWLHETIQLALSLLESSLSFDLGMCLIPQFVDFFEYMERQLNPETFKPKYMEKVRRCFSVFFSNISALLDSTNHSDRQFLQVPSFHSVSFEMPPKIMAFYIAVGHEIIKALNSTDTVYGLTISPKFAKELDVTSLALHNAISEDQFISLGIGEISFYTIRHTTGVLAHEISHYVGDTERCRKQRQEFVTRCALQEFVSEMIQCLPTILTTMYPCPEKSELTLRIKWQQGNEISKRLYDTLVLSNIAYRPNENTTSKDLLRLLGNLLEEVRTNPALIEEVCEQTWCVMNAVKEYEENRRIWEYLEQLVTENDMPSQGSQIVDNMFEKIKEAMIRRRVKELVISTVDALAGATNPNPTTEGKNGFAKRHLDNIALMTKVFEETFADLQSILLLGLEEGNYFDLFLNTGDGNIENDGTIPARALSVARTMIFSGLWKKQTVISHTNNKFFPDNLLESELRPQQCISEKINPTLEYYLECYLAACVDKMADKNVESERSQSVIRLQKIYRNLSSEQSAISLIKTIGGFVSDYSNSMVSTNWAIDGANPSSQTC